MIYSEKTIEAAKTIVAEFENNIPSLYEVDQFESESIDLTLYLAAKNFLRRYV